MNMGNVYQKETDGSCNDKIVKAYKCAGDSVL